MISLQLSEASAAMRGMLRGADERFAGVSTDSRTLAPDELFFALEGPRFDGHDMLDEVDRLGAAGAVVKRPSARPASQIVVDDTRPALGRLARAWRDRFTLPVLAVTGSAGKTTVKEMLGSIMRQRGPALVTQGNLNNDIGVPLTLFRLAEAHRAAVIEMGCNRPGDIATLVDIARPVLGLITLCAPAHLEGFGSIEAVAETKGEIVSGLADDGIAVINNADRFAPRWREMAGARRTVSFGAGGDVVADEVVLEAAASRFVLRTPDFTAAVALGFAGRHNVDNALAAAAAAWASGCTERDIVAGLAAAEPVAGRLRLRAGPPGVEILDDSYNANPVSVGAAIDVLAARGGSRWAVLGDMGELGDAAETYHREVGERARAAGLDRVYAVGELSAATAAAFGGAARHFTDVDELIEALEHDLAATVTPLTVLVKASRMMGLDRVVARLAQEGDG
ncbi:MAG: UDP-N-acetylmuramoyl-tripeptide--D-alanyl-D-alanine ligase [Gammaproteobacteria bacterium]